MTGCPGPADNLGAVRGVLASVDCQVQGYSKAAYLALSGPDSFFPAALTSLMVIYVALIGFRLMFGIGRARLADAPVVAVKLGLVLGLAFNWSMFETLVFNLATDAPFAVAQVVSGPMRGGDSALAADPLAGLQALYDEIGKDAEMFGRKAGPNPSLLQGGDALSSEKLWAARSTLFVGTAGVLALAVVAVGILVALGPVFIAFALLAETAGLFWGWLRALVGVALLPLLGWTTTIILLVTAEPWAQELASGRIAGHMSGDTADTLCLIINVFAAAQAALVIAATVIASGLVLNRHAPREQATGAAVVTAGAAPVLSRPERLAMEIGRHSTARQYAGAMTVSVERAGAGAALPAEAGGVGHGGRAGDAYWRNAHLLSGSGESARKTRDRS